MGFAYAEFAPRGVHAAAAEQSQGTCGFPDTLRVGLPGLILCRGQVRPPGECRLGKGFALPLAPNPVRQPAGFPTPFRGRLARSWRVQLIGAAAGRVQIGESFTLPLPPLESGATAAAPDTPWGGLTRFWRVQLIGAAAGREGFGGRAERTWSMSALEEKAQCGSHEDREAAGVRAFRLAE